MESQARPSARPTLRARSRSSARSDRAGGRRRLGVRHRPRELAHQPHERRHRGRRRDRDGAHLAATSTSTKMLTDIGSLAASIPGADAQGFDPSQLGAVSGAVTDASIDVYSGEDDHVLRKLDANLTIDPSAIAPEGAIPVANIQISVLGRDRRPQRGPDDRGAVRREADQRAARRPRRSTRARSAGSAAPASAAAAAAGGGGGDSALRAVHPAGARRRTRSTPAPTQL